MKRKMVKMKIEGELIVVPIYTKILIDNTNCKIEKITLKKALEKYDENYILKKYPEFKKELLENSDYIKNCTKARQLAVDRAYCAIGKDEYFHDFDK